MISVNQIGQPMLGNACNNAVFGISSTFRLPLFRNDSLRYLLRITKKSLVSLSKGSRETASNKKAQWDGIEIYPIYVLANRHSIALRIIPLHLCSWLRK